MYKIPMKRETSKNSVELCWEKVLWQQIVNTARLEHILGDPFAII